MFNLHENHDSRKLPYPDADKSGPNPTRGPDTEASRQDAMNHPNIAVNSSQSTLSVLIPAHNEAPALECLLPELLAALNAWPEAPAWEVIVVDDGSTDPTAEIVRHFADAEPRIRLLSNKQRQGQSSALALAVSEATGAWLATLDADGQNDPADLPRLWQQARLTGCDAVLGWRVNRRDNRKTRYVSRLANRVRNLLLGQEIRDTGCSTRLLRASRVAALPRFEGWHRFLGPMMAARGARIVQVPVNHRGREHGRSHYNWRNRGLKVVIDLLGVAWLNRRAITHDLAQPFIKEDVRIDPKHISRTNQPHFPHTSPALSEKNDFARGRSQ